MKACNSVPRDHQSAAHLEYYPRVEPPLLHLCPTSQGILSSGNFEMQPIDISFQLFKALRRAGTSVQLSTAVSSFYPARIYFEAP